MPQAAEPDPDPLHREYGFEQSPRHNDSESHRVALIAEKQKREDGEFLPPLILGSCPFLGMQPRPGYWETLVAALSRVREGLSLQNPRLLWGDEHPKKQGTPSNPVSVPLTRLLLPHDNASSFTSSLSV